MNMCIDVKQNLDRVIVKILRNPESCDELDQFLQLHGRLLQENHDLKQNVLVYFDVRELEFDFFCTTVYVPKVLAHFISKRELSDEVLFGCAVCVNNGAAATIIQGLIDANPGKVPTFISTQELECKLFLRKCRERKKPC